VAVPRAGHGDPRRRRRAHHGGHRLPRLCRDGDAGRGGDRLSTWRELPPTAGLPLQAGDLLGAAAAADGLGRTLQLAEPLFASSGAAALWLLLETLKARRPDRSTVVVPAFTCPLVALAVHQAGLELRICDARPRHFDLDLPQLRTLCGGDTLAVITTHLAGRLADAAGAATIAHGADAFLIEDAAQALGACSAARSVGLAGDAGFFSLGAGKGLSVYAGGLIVIGDAGLRAAVRQTCERLVQRRPLREAWRCLQLLGLALLYNPRGLVVAYGLPLRRALARGDVLGALSERFAPRIVAHHVSRWRRAVAQRAAVRLPAFLAAGRARSQARLQRLADIPGVEVLQDEPEGLGTWPCFIVLLPDTARRERALAHLWTAGLGVSRPFACALPDYPQLASIVPPCDVPNARDFAARTLTVSNTHWMRDDDFEIVRNAIARAAA
jgi:dTDP-4-amino-4,6-dideoxygalactose transaminase